MNSLYLVFNLLVPKYFLEHESNAALTLPHSVKVDAILPDSSNCKDNENVPTFPPSTRAFILSMNSHVAYAS
jgi:hypothetical protein